MQRIELSGTPRQRGLAHGETLKASIERSLAFYLSTFARPEAQLRASGEAVRARVGRAYPGLAEEIDAIADGAGQAHWRLHVMNARSELMSAVADGCTAVFSPEQRLLGQTWDWAEPLESFAVVMRIEREDGHRLLTVTEPGMVGKIGLNSAGLGVCLNFLFSPGRLNGLPVHVLLRAVMEASGIEEARRRLESAEPGQSGNLLIGSADGAGLDVELAGAERSFHALGDVPFAHTNHHLWHDIDPGPVAPSSNARLDAAHHHLERRGVKDLEDLRALLSDQSHAHFPICSPYLDAMNGLRLGTLCTVLMDLPARAMEVRRGPDPAAPFDRFTLD